MKIKYLNIIFLFFISALILLGGCKEEDNWGGTTYTKYAPANLTDPTVSGIVDTAFTVTYTLTEPGALNLYIVPAGTENPDSTDIVSNATTRIEMTAAGDAVYTFALDSADIEPGASWDVFATYASTFGVLSLVNQSVATTVDTRKPILDIASCSPAHESTGNAKDAEIVLTFTEAVQYVDGKEIRIEASLSGVQSITTAADVTVSGNTVTLAHSDFVFADEVVIVFEAGSFVDFNGHEVLELVSGDYAFSVVPYDIAGFVGEFDVLEESDYDPGNPYNYTDMISLDPDKENGLILSNYWDGGYAIKIYFDDNGMVHMESQYLFTHTSTGADAYAISLDLLNTEDIVGQYDPNANTISMYTGVMLTGLGYFDKIYSEYTPVTIKKSSISNHKIKKNVIHSFN